LRPPLCERCGNQVAWPVSRCGECAGRRLAFDSARAAVAYEGAGARLVGAWKEGGRRRLARVAADLVTEQVAAPSSEAATFVPAVADRSLWRGYNPARALATELAAAWHLPCLELLARAGTARRQRGLPLAERRVNVRGAFEARESVPRTVILVDDVYTTGATVAAAASALRVAGARRVDVVTFARTLRRGG